MQKFGEVEAAAIKILSSMKGCGFEIKSRVEVVVDDKLDFMGYTRRNDNGYIVVISGFSTGSGMLETLLLHEMSHIYRMESGHFSHNDVILTNVLNHVAIKNKISKESELQMLHQAVNHIQDLYADDIVFKVITENKLVKIEKLDKFFFNWIKTELFDVDDEVKQKWINASMMLNNAFALSNMERHGILSDEAMVNNGKFLSSVGKISGKFSYFKNFMTNLKEYEDEEKFEKEMVEYLDNFVKLAV